MQQRRLTGADSFAFRNAIQAQIAPDGSRVAIILSWRDVATDRKRSRVQLGGFGEAWVDPPGGEGAHLIRWAPDSRQLAWLSFDTGRHVLWVHDLATGETRDCVNVEQILRELAWSPDGTRIAFQRREILGPPSWLGLPAAPDGTVWAEPIRYTERLVYRRDQVGEWPEGSFQTCVVAAGAKTAARTITTGTWWHGMPHLVTPGLTGSADGTELLMTGTRSETWNSDPQDIDLHAVRVADGAVRRLTAIAGQVSDPRGLAGWRLDRVPGHRRGAGQLPPAPADADAGRRRSSAGRAAGVRPQHRLDFLVRRLSEPRRNL